jgi:hypothetical protein
MFYLPDKQAGEWMWGVQEDYSIMTGGDKAGIWKCRIITAAPVWKLFNVFQLVLNSRQP